MKKRSDIVLIPDYSFAARIGCDNEREGILHQRCDMFCEDTYGRCGAKKVMGNRCVGCGFTFWVDPINGGIDDKRDSETIWKATKEVERLLNRLDFIIEEEEKKR